MRARHGWGGLVLLICLVGSLFGQNASTFIGGFSPSQIVNVPVDTSKTVAPVSFPKANPIQFPLLARLFNLIPRFRLSMPAHPIDSVPQPGTKSSTPANKNPFQPQLPFFPQN